MGKKIWSQKRGDNDLARKKGRQRSEDGEMAVKIWWLRYGVQEKKGKKWQWRTRRQEMVIEKLRRTYGNKWNADENTAMKKHCWRAGDEEMTTMRLQRKHDVEKAMMEMGTKEVKVTKSWREDGKEKQWWKDGEGEMVPKNWWGRYGDEITIITECRRISNDEGQKTKKSNVAVVKRNDEDGMTTTKRW